MHLVGRSFEQAELEALALDTSSCQSYSKQSSMVDTQSVQSFVYQDGAAVQQQQQQQQQQQIQQQSVVGKPQRSNSAASFERSNSRNSDDIPRSRKTLRWPADDDNQIDIEIKYKVALGAQQLGSAPESKYQI